MDDVIVWGDKQGVSAVIQELENTFELRWADGVANEWTEEYSTLSAAVIRLGVLIACAESSWEANFLMTDATQFDLAATMFLVGQVG